MIKRILVPLDASLYAVSALEYACVIAKAHGAQVSGLAVLDMAGIERSVGPYAIGGMHYARELEEALEKTAHQHIGALLGQFKEKCEREGVAHSEAERQGSPSERIVEDAMFYDLMVVGMRTRFKFETDEEPDDSDDSLEEILDHCVTPVLAVPEQFDGLSERRALIAFNGSLPAARALKRFVQLAGAMTFSETTILMSHEDMDVANHYLDSAEAYLLAHDIPNLQKAWTPDDIGDAVREDYLERTDLLVVGAHSKRGLLDFGVGSLTETLLRHARKPVLVGL